MIDCHCHLAYPGMVEILDEIIEESKNMRIITCGYPKDCKKSLQLARENENIFLALGLHPIDISKMSDKEVDGYLDCIREHADEIVAVGEIGLDYHLFKDEKENERFRKVFVQCLELAKEISKPVVLHTRKAEQECFDIVKRMKMERVNFHCYSGSLTLAKSIIDSGYYISIATNVKNSKNSMKIAKNFPIDRLLTETDSPFLSPIKGKVNRPVNVKLILETVAELRKMPVEEIDRMTTENAEKFFGLKSQK